MPNPNNTGTVSLGSDLERKKWLKQNLVTVGGNQSFWAPYKGRSSDSIIMQVDNRSASAGNTVVFDMRGPIEAKAIRGNQTAEGTGVQKRKFSDKVTIEAWRWTVDNGTKFSAKAINDLTLTEHADSVAELGKMWTKTQDQGYFDLAQQTSEFGLKFDNKFDYESLLRLEYAAKMGEGFDTSPNGLGRRLPLAPFTTQGGHPMWLLVIDTPTKLKLLSQAKGAQTLLSAVDVRGNGSRLLSGVIGKIGNFVIVEAPSFLGFTEGNIVDAGDYYNFDNTSVFAAGLRRYVTNVGGGGTKEWEGTREFSEAIGIDGKPKNKDLYSRGILLGAGAFQFAMGMDPDYHLRMYDFNKFSESCLEVWCGLKPAKLKPENDDYRSVNVANYNLGTIFVDVKLN